MEQTGTGLTQPVEQLERTGMRRVACVLHIMVRPLRVGKGMPCIVSVDRDAGQTGR